MDKKGFGIIDILIILAAIVLGLIAVLPMMMAKQDHEDLVKDHILKQQVMMALEKYGKMNQRYVDSLDSLGLFLAFVRSDSLVKQFESTFDRAEREKVLAQVTPMPSDSIKAIYICPKTKNPFKIELFNNGTAYKIYCDFAGHDTLTSEK